jgi:predicted metal-dependent phosphotriesterase family hydrolase
MSRSPQQAHQHKTQNRNADGLMHIDNRPNPGVWVVVDKPDHDKVRQHERRYKPVKREGDTAVARDVSVSWDLCHRTLGFDYRRDSGAYGRAFQLGAP